MKQYNATFVITESEIGAKQPFNDPNNIYHRQYANSLAELLEKFQLRISLIDVGYIQIWQYSDNLDKYIEIGHLYI